MTEMALLARHGSVKMENDSELGEIDLGRGRNMMSVNFGIFSRQAIIVGFALRTALQLLTHNPTRQPALLNTRPSHAHRTCNV